MITAPPPRHPRPHLGAVRGAHSGGGDIGTPGLIKDDVIE